MYNPLFKSLLFRFEPETAHDITLKGLRFLHSIGILKEFIPTIADPREVMGLRFANAVGLAAGLDKNGEYIDALADLGFGFIEVGTITKLPQEGNPKPRLFRVPTHSAIINRLGFNNKGLDYLIEQLKKTQFKGILGINIGKNRDTANEDAIEEYLFLFRRVAKYASYVTINISSPNTQNLRDLQHGEMLQALLKALKQEQHLFFELNKKYVPLVVKIAPDLDAAQIQAMAEIFLAEKIDGVIATNTTLDREAIKDSPLAGQSGGLSGQPLRKRSTQVVAELHAVLKNSIPIIACGGILKPEDAQEKIAAGASLVQVYSGLIYKGPSLIEECAKQLKED